MKTTIIVADANERTRKTLVAAINDTADMSVIAQTGDGEALLRLCRETKCDLIAMELILSSMDGLNVLGALNRMAHRPKVLVLTRFVCGNMIEMSDSLGADYFMIKPYHVDAVVEQIRRMTQPIARAPIALHPIEQTTVAGVLREIGVPAHIKGYRYLQKAILMAMVDGDVIHSMTKRLYPDIAKCYKTKAACVERAMRHAIETTWNRGNSDTLNKYFSATISGDRGKPTNGEFIAMIADRLRMEWRVFRRCSTARERGKAPTAADRKN